MNGTPMANSSTTCLRPVTLSSSVMTPPSITMLFSEKRGRPSSGLGGSSGLGAVISATRCCTSEKLKRVTSSRTIDSVGERRVKRSTTGANQNSEVQAALTSSSEAVNRGVCEPGCATARSCARTVRVKGLKVILPTATSRPSILATSWVSTLCSTLGTCQAAMPQRISAVATTPKRILPKRRVNRNLGIRKGIVRLLVRIEGHYRVLRTNWGGFLQRAIAAAAPQAQMPPQGHESTQATVSAASLRGLKAGPRARRPGQEGRAYLSSKRGGWRLVYHRRISGPPRPAGTALFNH
ncbi:hypothetical protein LMG1864_05435 [Achromobacter ruhlandii]|nr:hypothetical protein LMG1864_05435 [Achromobacter ruhlandii]